MVRISYNAMHRYRVESIDGNQSSQHNYVPVNQQISSKKTWIERLRLTKTEKQSLSPITESLSSNVLSCPMKYAEPWLYGTVRGIPARPTCVQPIFTPLPTEVAVVVCSCPEYLSGTKRELKKASICKKCKGSRLPLAPIGGTLHITSTTAPTIHKSRGGAGTMRLLTTSTKKSRPSILDPKNDLYDLMGRTRLLSPEPKLLLKPSDKRNHCRAKGTGSTRGRSRSRLKHVSPPPFSVTITDNIFSLKSCQSKISVSTTNSKQDCWIDTLEPDSGVRRSILHSNVNPYDLISTNSSTHNMNEFSPIIDDDDFFDTTRHPARILSKPIENTVNYSNIKEIAGQRISLGHENAKSISSLMAQTCESFSSDIINVKNESNVRDEKVNVKPKLEQKPQQIQQQRLRIHQVQNEKIMKENNEVVDVRQQQPKRPPRRKHETDLINEHKDVHLTNTKIRNDTEIGRNLLRIKSSPAHPQMSLETVSSQRQGEIKSILKRPFNLTSSVSTSIGTEKDVNNFLDDAIVSNDFLTISNYEKILPKMASLNNETKCNDKTSGSQFYLPLLPTRKKVQFMVDDKIIMNESDENVTLTENKNKVITMNAREMSFVHNEQDSISFIKQQRDNQQEILEVLLKKQERKVNKNDCEREELKRKEDNEDYNNKVDDISMSTKHQIEGSSKLLTNGETVSLSPKSSLGVFIPSSTLSDCLIVMKQDERKNNNLSVIESFTGKDEGNECTAQVLDTIKQSCLRTLSDRRSNTTTIILNFNDSMALRVNDTRAEYIDIFSANNKRNQQKKQFLQENELVQKREHLYQQHQQQKEQQNYCINQNQQLLLNLENEFPLKATSNTVTQLKVNTDKTILKSGIKKFSQKQNELSTLNQQQQQHQEQEKKHQMVEKLLSSKSIKQQLSGKILPQEDRGVLTIKKDLNCCSSSDKENTIRNENDCENPNTHNDFNANASIAIDSAYCNETKFKSQQNHQNVNQFYEHKAFAVKEKPDDEGDEEKKKKKNEDNNNKNEDKKKQKLLHTQSEIYNDTRLFRNQSNKPILEKTVVRVAPFNKTSEIHSLKIQHEDDININDNVSQKKTSILLNGDDFFYSTVDVNNDTPIYQSSIVVTDEPKIKTIGNLNMLTTTNTVRISVNNNKNRTPEEEIIYKNNKINTYLSQELTKSVIPIVNGKAINNTMKTSFKNDGDNSDSVKRLQTIITLDKNEIRNIAKEPSSSSDDIYSHKEELVKILRNPVEAVKRNLVPHVCGKSESTERGSTKNLNLNDMLYLAQNKNSFVGKLLQDSALNQLAEELDSDIVVKLIKNSLKRLKDSKNNIDTSGTKNNDDMMKLIETCLRKIQEDRNKLENSKKIAEIVAEQQESHSNRESISSGNNYNSVNYEFLDFEKNESDCYQSCSSEVTADYDSNATGNKFYQMLVDATLSDVEISTNNGYEHHYESIRLNGDPIYEEISEVPPPLPLIPPPTNDPDFEKKNARSIFEGASKYDILSYLVDAKERGIVREESYEYNFSNTSDIILEEGIDTLSVLKKKQVIDINNRTSHLSIISDSSEDISLTSSYNEKTTSPILITSTAPVKAGQQRKPMSDIERNDSGVGSETSKSSRRKYQSLTGGYVLNRNSLIHLCEDCEGPVETQIIDSEVVYAPLVCRKCGKKRVERKEIITEIVETEEKYGRDLQIILEEFCHPMLVAGLLTQEQLSSIFLNTEELLENNQTLAERMRDALDIALEQGDDDLLTVNMGKMFLECTSMLHSFESYCVRQANASLLLANLEKEKELLRIFLRVSQMENTVLRRMNLNSFLMVPVQRVTKYPLLLSRLYKVTPSHLEGRELLKQAKEKIELHLNHMNEEAKDVPTKLWRRISSSSPNRRAPCEIDIINIKLRKMAIDVLEWNNEEVRFAMEGKLLFTQPTDNNWKKGRTIKLTPVNGLLVTNGKPSTNYKAEKALSDQLNFPKHIGIREATLLVVKEKCGRYTLIREPLYLDKCVICTEADLDDYFEVHEISSKDTFIFKAEDGVRSKQWYTQLQYHAQGMGAWRKRRNALANIMINGMLSRT